MDTVVTVIGVLVDQWLRDDGSGSMVLVDLSDGATARVVCEAFDRLCKGVGIWIGDEIMATGVVSGSKNPPTVFAAPERIVLLRESEHVLTVSTLSSNWMLFIGDRFDIRGVVVGELPGCFRLLDDAGRYGLTLACRDDLSVFVGAEVVVDGRLVVDRSNMFLVLDVEGISLLS